MAILDSHHHVLSEVARTLRTLRKYQLSYLRLAGKSDVDILLKRDKAARTRKLLSRAIALREKAGLRPLPSKGIDQLLHNFFVFLSGLILGRGAALKHAVTTTEAHLSAVAAGLLATQPMEPQVHRLVRSVRDETDDALSTVDRILISQTH